MPKYKELILCHNYIIFNILYQQVYHFWPFPKAVVSYKFDCTIKLLLHQMFHVSHHLKINEAHINRQYKDKTETQVMSIHQISLLHFLKMHKNNNNTLNIPVDTHGNIQYKCPYCYNKVQHPLFSLTGLVFISRTISINTSFTLFVLLAEVSINGQFHICARAAPS